MRIAVIADVHGNLEALEAVVIDLKRSLPDTVISLGDVVGYGANPQECCDIVKDTAHDNIMGNHDAAVTDVIDTESFNDDAKQSIQWTKEQLTGSYISWLRNAPYTLEHEGALFSHGSPVNPEEFDYIMSIYDVEKVFYAFGRRYSIFFVGHSHRRFFVSKDIDGDEEPIVDYSDVVNITEHRQYIISVGSVGQPRDFDNTTSYGILDTDKSIYSVKRLNYAIKKASDKILNAGLPKWLAYRLMIGA
jgi:diadenosine tetraphosphatase ApaH/serine/threonine PP2A family protein phosphatase